jgi:hypothetical protein
VYRKLNKKFSQSIKLTPFAPLHPVDPPFPNSQNPTCPAPNNDDLGNILALGVQNSSCLEKDTNGLGLKPFNKVNISYVQIAWVKRLILSTPIPPKKYVSKRWAEMKIQWILFTDKES